MWNKDLEGNSLEIAGTTSSPLLVDAGPGTGKTFTMMRRIWRLISEQARPERIFVGTFTRTSASDLRRSLDGLGVEGADRVYAGTLHSFCFGLLNNEAVFEITNRVPRPLMKFEERFLLEDLCDGDFGGVEKCGDRLEAFNTAWARLQTDQPGWLSEEIDRKFNAALLSWLRFHRAMHIGEVIWLAYSFLRDNPGSEYRSKFDHVLVDEYQDLNRAEQALLDLLAEPSTLTVIGDEDQSIYSFRYANPEGMRDFARRHEHADPRSMLECRRCPKRIVDIANSLISRNLNRAQRQLIHHAPKPDGEIHFVQWGNPDEEAAGVARFIAAKIDNGSVGAGDVLVLSPRRQLGYAVRDHLSALGVNVHSFFAEKELEGNPKKSETNGAQKAFTLITLLANREDPVALRCWVGFDKSTLSKSGWSKIRGYCEDNGVSPWTCLELLEVGEIQFPYTDAIVAKFRELKSLIDALEPLQGQKLVDALLPATTPWAEPMRALLAGKVTDDLSAAAIYETLLISIAQPELPTAVDFVRVMSLHKSKGLTAKLVVVLGCVEGLVPFIDTKKAQAEQQKQLEEQRRLFYVALTRATDTLLVSSFREIPAALAPKLRARTGPGRWGMLTTIASRFLSELGPSRPVTQTGKQFLQEMGIG